MPQKVRAVGTREMKIIVFQKVIENVTTCSHFSQESLRPLCAQIAQLWDPCHIYPSIAWFILA